MGGMFTSLSLGCLYGYWGVIDVAPIRLWVPHLDFVPLAALSVKGILGDTLNFVPPGLYQQS